jgi:hypothetical protein
VVSAAAAAVWHHRGELTRYELMEGLHQSGDPLDDPFTNGEPLLARLLPSTGQKPVHRISLCQALDQACPNSSCSGVGPLECIPWQRERPQDEVSLDAPSLDASLIEYDREPLGEPCPDWLQYLEKSNGLPSETCPPGIPFGIDDDAWTGPQPEDIPCPSCPVKSETGEGGNKVFQCPTNAPYTLYFSVHSGYQGGQITQLTVEIGTHAYLVDFTSLPQGPLNKNDSIKIECLPEEDIDKGVALSFLSELHGAGMNSVVVVE